jgi:hypothetical protein
MVSFLKWIGQRNILGSSEASIEFTIDVPDEPPVTQLTQLKEVHHGTAIHLTWSLLEGENDISSFHIQYRDNGRNWIDMDKIIPAQNRDKWFIGEFGHTYEFRISGLDHAGNRETFHESNIIKTTIESECNPDNYELGISDDAVSNATPIEYGETQFHNFCGLDDVDWVTIHSTQGQVILLQATPEGEDTAVYVQLFEVDGLPVLEEQTQHLFGFATEFRWEAPHDGIYHIRLRPLDPRLAGTDVKYSIRVDKLHQVYSPGLLVSSFVLPIIWAAWKFFHKIRNTED